MYRLIVVSFLAWFSSVAQASTPSQEYPYRVRYPDVTIITTVDLAKRLNEVVVIDVRSKYEFETLHIKGAVNIPLKTNFGDKIAALRKDNNKPFVFYCNGKTCQKSYEAVLRADKARLDRLYAFDAGIFDWAKAQPDHTVLLGKTPIMPGELISGEAFKARLLEPKAFESRMGSQAIVLDVRDLRQRDSALFPMREQRAQLSELKKIDGVIDQARAGKKTLLVYDEVGKQVQWFQYYLERKGLKDYYFMKGGAEGHFNATYGKVVLGGEEKGKRPVGAGSAGAK